MTTELIGYKSVPVYKIPVTVLENEEDWEFTVLSNGEGYTWLSVF